MKLIILFILLLSNNYAQHRWVKLNGSEGGVITGLFAKGDTVVAGTGYNKANIFYSFDRGLNWNKAKIKLYDRFEDFIYTDDGGILAINPNNGIYRSYDFSSWEKLNIDGDFWSLGKDKNGNIYSGADQNRIYVSLDNGNNWSLSWSGVENIRITGFHLTPDSLFFAGIQGKILRMNYETNKWEVVLLDSALTVFYKIFSGEKGEIYASSLASILISQDSGATWKRQLTGSFFNGNKMYETIFNKKLIGAFGDQTGWFGDGWGAAVSDDKGITWRWTQTGLPPKISGLDLAVSGNDTFLGTNAAGVFKSTDFGESWFSVNNGIYAAEVIDFIFDEQGDIYTSSWSNGAAKSTDKGATWKVINNGLTNVYMYSILSDNDGVLYAGSDQGLFRSTDKGENWVQTTNFGNSYAYRLHKDKLNRIYAITYGYGIYRSSDKGFSWERLDKGFSNSYVFGFAIDSSGNMYAGTRGGYIYKSTDDGVSWTEIRNTIHTTSVIERISIASNGYIFATTTREGVLRSKDEGKSWENVNNGLGSLTTSPLAIDKNDRIYTTTSELKIYQSDDYGESWIDITANLNMISISKIMFDEDYVYLSTDESMWRSNPDSLTTIAEDESSTPKEYTLSQNYPNPFNPNTIIKYQIPEHGYVTLKIYDILGKEIATLVNEEKTAGRYEVTFNASNLSSGVYIYQVKVNEFVSSRKMVLMK